MIDNNLIHFQRQSDFENAEVDPKSIVFVKDSSNIYTHDEEYNFISWGYLEENQN